MCFWGLQLSQVQSLSSNLKGSVELQISSATNANFCQLDLKCTAVVSVTSVHVANASGYTRQLYINQDDFTIPLPGYFNPIPFWCQPVVVTLPLASNPKGLLRRRREVPQVLLRRAGTAVLQAGHGGEPGGVHQGGGQGREVEDGLLR